MLLIELDAAMAAELIDLRAKVTERANQVRCWKPTPARTASTRPKSCVLFSTSGRLSSFISPL